LYAYRVARHNNAAPPQIIVAACPAVPPHARVVRAPHRYLRFYADETAFKIYADQPTDAVTGIDAEIMLKNRDAKIEIGDVELSFTEQVQNGYPLMSSHIETRTVRTSDGEAFGTDEWGRLKTGERWRYVSFASGDLAGYRPSEIPDADAMDRLLATLCISDEPRPY